MDNQQPTGGEEWGNIRFGSRSHQPTAESAEDRAQSRFLIGLGVFLAVALAYPWYSYWVSAWITTRGLEHVAQQLEREFEQAGQQARQQQAVAAQAQATSETRRRIDSVRVVGATRTRNGPVVIVRLGDATTGEAASWICTQAEALLGESLDGETVRVQRHRGSAPALDAGKISC